MKCTLSFFLLLVIAQANAQYSFKAVVKDKATGQLLSGATVSIQHATGGATSDSMGAISIGGLPAGNTVFIISYISYKPDTLNVVLPDTIVHQILLEATEPIPSPDDVVVIASTRTGEPIENATTKVEVLGIEEMNEESTMKPTNIASILGDISGVQIQQSSAVSGNANVRILGLDGRYTQLLRDGMPLYDGFSGGFGVLSILPLDLKQVELIKGSASTLFGGGAIGGLINFVSKRPGYKPDASFIINQTTLKETNLNAYYAQRWKKVGFTFFAGQTVQKEVDVDKDGLSDVPELRSTTIHPVLFLYPTEKSSVSLGWSGSFDKRTGGDMIAIHKPEAAHPYFETNKLQRNTFTLIADNRFTSRIAGTIKSSISLFDRNIFTNTYTFKGQQQNYYTEASLVAHTGKHTIVGGANITGDHFAPNVATPAPVGTISNTALGLFAQDTWQLLARTKLEGGLRIDRHFTYGTFVLPRLALFHKFNDTWGTRMGFGMGYKNPNPLTPQIIDYEIYAIDPLPAGIKAETSFGANAEINYKKEWGHGNSFFINHAFFLTQINNPVIGTENALGRLHFATQNKPILTRGFDTYIQANLHGLELYAGYTYTIAERKYLAQNQFVPLTPRNRGAATIVYEIEGKWRFGLEGSYNGQQYRDGDTKTPDYIFIAAMTERKLGKKWSLILNCENLFDERQSRYERIFTGSITNPTYKPIWAPIDGRAVNLCLRWQPFAG